MLHFYDDFSNFAKVQSSITFKRVDVVPGKLRVKYHFQVLIQSVIFVSEFCEIWFVD